MPIDPIRVTVWYAQSIRTAFTARSPTARSTQPEHGLTDEVLGSTDVLTLRGYRVHKRVADEVVVRVQQHVLNGTGLIVLHSGNESKIFTRLTGTTCALRWREADDHEHVWTVNPNHSIAAGIPSPPVVPAQETYGEFFDIPQPDELAFLSTFSGGGFFTAGAASGAAGAGSSASVTAARPVPSNTGRQSAACWQTLSVGRTADRGIARRDTRR